MLSTRDIQRLLTSAGYYNAGIDGDFGPKSKEAVHKLLAKHRPEAFSWSEQRQQIAAVQIILHFGGWEPGAIDGWYGNNTREAFNAWDYHQATEKYELLPGRSGDSGEDEFEFEWPSQRNVTKVFGAAGSADCSSGRAKLPFPFPLAWNLSTRVETISCHVKVVAALESIFGDAAKHYGEEDYRNLGLDLYGGCYNYRKMRGGTNLSMHSWGIAVDLNPEQNQLRWGRDRALFARPNYDPFWKIVEAHGAISLGRERNYDWMHFQFATL